MPAHRGFNGRCTMCTHPERTRAELLLAGGASFSSVGRKYGVGKYAVRRHWLGHVSDERRAALLVGPVSREALAARVGEEAGSVLDHLKVVRSGLYALYDAAVTAGDRNGGALLAGRLHENLSALARLTGELASSPLVQITQQNVFVHDPQFARFQADLIRVLSRFPEAREAVIAEFSRLEAEPTEPLALEHHHAEAATEATAAA